VHDDPPMGVPSREAFGGMELLGRLSSGGMGEVLLARRRGAHGFEKLVAVKTIRGDLARRPDVRQMFLDEARLMARLEHPSIAQVYDFGEADQIPYLAMEYVPGMVVSRLLTERPRPIPQSVVVQFGIEVCRGLHAAHELTDPEGNPLGVVHRDITPHNLMITFDGRVKILDFGIALRRGREAPPTEFGIVKGKITYVAPEQLSGGRADRRSDIYSLAVVLHEMLTGRKLFTSNNPIADAFERKNVPRPSALVRDVSPALEAAIMRALALEPSKRFEDAREMSLALESAAAGIRGETIYTFVERELKEERHRQKTRLSSVRSGEDLSDLVRAEFPSAPGIPVKVEDVLDEKVQPAAQVSASFFAGERETRSFWNFGRFVTALLLSAAVGLFAFDLVKAEKTRRREAASIAPVREPAAVELGVVDAEVPVLLEADVRVPSAAELASKVEVVGESEKKVSSTKQAAALREKSPEPKRNAEVPSARDKKPSAAKKPAVRQEAAKKKPVKASRRATPGYLTIEAKPNAVVVIDGKVAGFTPLKNVKLAPGKHTIELRKPKTRVLTAKRSVVIREGRRHRLAVGG
jgi:serine/threonine protein kinase